MFFKQQQQQRDRSKSQSSSHQQRSQSTNQLSEHCQQQQRNQTGNQTDIQTANQTSHQTSHQTEVQSNQFQPEIKQQQSFSSSPQVPHGILYPEQQILVQISFLVQQILVVQYVLNVQQNFYKTLSNLNHYFENSKYSDKNDKIFAFKFFIFHDICDRADVFQSVKLQALSTMLKGVALNY